MDWIVPFYTQQDVWLSPGQVFDYDRVRADTLERLAGRAGPLRILELGAGPGGTAVALAERGHTLVAVELVAGRVARARELAVQAGVEARVTVVAADFYAYTPEAAFDVVCYWDGFGIGADADQRRLLQRVAALWLAPHGCSLIEVYHPCGQILAAGQEDINTRTGVKRRYDYDPLHARFIDRWWAADAPERVFTQALRCYSPADLELLLEGTGLRLEAVEVKGVPVDLGALELTMQTPLGQAWSFVAKLVRG